MSNVVVSKDELRQILGEALHTSPPGKVSLSHEELEDMTAKVLQRTLLSFGFDAKSAIDMQKDMAFLRSLRKGSESMKARTVLALLGLLITASGSLLVMSLKSFFSGGHK